MAIDAAVALPEQGPGDHQPGQPGQRRRVRRRVKVRRSRRGLLLLGAATPVLAAVVVGGAALVMLHEAHQAESHLTAVRSDIAQLRDSVHTGDTSRLIPLSADLRSQADAAQRETHGALWRVAAKLPVIGNDARLARGLTDGVDDLAFGALPQLIDSAAKLRPASLLSGGRVDLAQLASVQPTVTATGPELAATLATVAALPSTSHFAALTRARTDLIAQLVGAQGNLRGAQQALSLAPDLLGAAGPRHYFLAFVNTSESRTGGGLLGTYGVLTTDHGTITLDHTGPDTELEKVGTGDADVAVTLPAEYAQTPWWSLDSAGAWYRANLSPDFPTTATIWATKYAAQTHTTIDGVISLDPTALGYLLGNRSVTLSDGTVVTGRTLAADTLSTFYARYTDVPTRHARLVELAQQAFEALRSSIGAGSLGALARGANEGRLQIWSDRPAEETQLAALSLGGQLPDAAGPFAWVGVNNLAGTKADYWLDRTVSYTAAACPPPGAGNGGLRSSTITVQLTNTEPAGQPAYVVTRYDAGHVKQADGSTALQTTVYAAQGAALDSATLDGQPVDVSVAEERGHPTYTLGVELPRGVTQTLVLHLLEPTGGTATQWRPQPMSRAENVVGDVAVCP